LGGGGLGGMGLIQGFPRVISCMPGPGGGRGGGAGRVSNLSFIRTGPWTLWAIFLERSAGHTRGTKRGHKTLPRRWNITRERWGRSLHRTGLKEENQEKGLRGIGDTRGAEFVYGGGIGGLPVFFNPQTRGGQKKKMLGGTGSTARIKDRKGARAHGGEKKGEREGRAQQ